MANFVRNTMKHTLNHMKMTAIILIATLTLVSQGLAQTIHVSPRGNDLWTGTAERPVATLAKAQELARGFCPDTNVEVILDDGIYYLPETFRFTARDSKTYPATVTYRAKHSGKAVISGGQQIRLEWTRQKDHQVWTARMKEGGDMDQLYINGKRQRMARFPNAVPEKGRNVFDTWTLSHNATYRTDMDPLAHGRTARWKNPAGGILHAMHSALWGDMHWTITGKSENDSLIMEGGWQNNRPSAMHPVYRMVENIKEELDAPGEWFYDKTEERLYLIPEPGTDMKNAIVEVVRLKHLIEFTGSKEKPVTGVNLEGLVFRHTRRTFMENREPLLRSDWTIYRGGAVVYDGAEDCTLTGCEFDQVGGNTIFVNNYNRRIGIKRCYIHQSGANGIAFVGDPESVRSPLFRYGDQDYARMDTVSGPKGDNYPMECRVEDCLITQTGRDEKQTAPIQISMSRRITVSHCSIHDVPRAGINISEGTFGGHLIEYCDIFNTVLETGDHGSFNSWGRDRYWTPDVKTFSRKVAANPEMTCWDMPEPNVIRHNRWRCDHGWDIDLDDGSSHYRIYNNVLLNGGLKLREGYDRIVTNNIILNNSLHPHVWPRGNGDVFMHNIVFGAYRPAAMQTDMKADEKWGKTLDRNLFATGKEDMERFSHNGADLHSRYGDPMFLNADKGDYRTEKASPARSIGFQDFPTDEFGVRDTRLRQIARRPALPDLQTTRKTENTASPTSRVWLGAHITEAKGSGLSAFGVGFDKKGIAFGQMEEKAPAAKWGLKSGDLLQSINGIRITGFNDLQDYIERLKGENKTQELSIIRKQETVTVRIPASVLRAR